MKAIQKNFYEFIVIGSGPGGSITANKLNKNPIMNPLTNKEADLVMVSLIEDSFRYDASELMERKIGADALWKALKNYIDMGRERAYRGIEDITEELDSNF